MKPYTLLIALLCLLNQPLHANNALVLRVPGTDFLDVKKYEGHEIALGIELKDGGAFRTVTYVDGKSRGLGLTIYLEKEATYRVTEFNDVMTIDGDAHKLLAVIKQVSEIDPGTGEGVTHIKGEIQEIGPLPVFLGLNMPESDSESSLEDEL